MGKFNEIQEEVKQSFGSNSFTTTVKEDTVEFDSAKDSFTFKDEVNVPSLKINGEAVQAGPADWNDLKNKPFYETEKSLWGDQVIRLAGNQLEGADEQGRVYFTPAKTIKPGDSFTVIIGNEYKMVVNVAGTDETGGGGGSLVNIETGLPGLGGGSILYFDYGQSGAIQLGADPATVSGELSCTVDVLKGIDSKYVPQLGGVQFRLFGPELQYTFDGGITWKTVANKGLLDVTVNSTPYYFDWPYGSNLEFGKSYIVSFNGQKGLYETKLAGDNRVVYIQLPNYSIISYDPMSQMSGHSGSIEGETGHYIVE